MSSTIDYPDFWQRFTAAEKASGALNLRVLGIQIYPMLRVKLYYQIAQQIGLFDAPHPHPESQVTEAEAMPNLDALKNFRAKDVVVPFSRRVGGQDPYSQPVIDILGSKSLTIDFDAPEAPFDINRLRAYFGTKFEDQVARAMRKISPEAAQQRWAKIIEAFEQGFGIEIGKYREYPKWLVRRHIIEALGFREVFRKLGARRLFIVNAYSHPSIVVGAKLARTKVYELQHGFLSKFHPAYSYPGRPKVQSSPNRLLTWGDYWNTAADLPRNTKAITAGPTSQFAAQRRELRAGQNSSSQVPAARRVLFTSQGALGPQLFAAAVEFARCLPDHQIIYRLHPNESLEDYKPLLAAQSPSNLGPSNPSPSNLSLSNLSLSNLSLSHREPIFLELLAETEFLVGGFSTTLFEGLALGLKVLVLPLPGYENMQPAIEAADVTVLKAFSQLGSGTSINPVALQAILSNAKPAKDPSKYYAEQNNLEKAIRA